MPTTIVVSEVTGHREVFRADGERLRLAIEKCWPGREPIEVDFEGRVIASASFFDESFGVLALNHPAEQLEERLRPLNLTEPDRRLLNDVVMRRVEERAERMGPSSSAG